MKKWIFIIPFVLFALVACGPTATPESEVSVVADSSEATKPPLAEVATEAPPTAVSELPTAVPTSEPPAEPTVVPTDPPLTEAPTEVPTEEPVAETAVIAGRLDEGAFFLGAVDAPVTMIDYSDFL